MDAKIQRESLTDWDTKSTYYTNWIYGAIHMLTGISDFSTSETISKRLGLDVMFVEGILIKLEKMGFIKRIDPNSEKKTWQRKLPDLNLPRNSPLSNQNHLNWRSKAMMEIQMNKTTNLHYTSSFTVSRKDLFSIQELVGDFIANKNKVISTSGDEELACFICDFFVL